jgi:hypothetical protein
MPTGRATPGSIQSRPSSAESRGAVDVPPPPTWAVACAWTVPLTILPSAIWRVTLLFENGRPLRAVDDGGWYLLLLSGLSLGLGLLTLGLVQPWGTVLPRWIPYLGGRVVPARAATVAACTGAAAVMGIEIYGYLNALFDLHDPKDALRIGPVVPQAEPGPVVDALYFPMNAWGPLLIAVAINYHRRRTGPR